jgi:hypothetical protein
MEKEKRSEDEEPEEKFSPTASPRGRNLRLYGSSPRSFSSDSYLNLPLHLPTAPTDD